MSRLPGPLDHGLDQLTTDAEPTGDVADIESLDLADRVAVGLDRPQPDSTNEVIAASGDQQASRWAGELVQMGQFVTNDRLGFEPHAESLADIRQMRGQIFLEQWSDHPGWRRIRDTNRRWRQNRKISTGFGRIAHVTP